MVDREHPDVRNLIRAIGRHDPAALAWIDIGYQDWNELCRALGQASDGDEGVAFLGYQLRIGSFPSGVRAVPKESS